MLTFFGILAIVAAIVAFIVSHRIKGLWKNFREETKAWNELSDAEKNRYRRPSAPDTSETLIPSKLPLILVGVGVVLTMFGSLPVQVTSTT